jgi:hypothetical protein
MSFTSANYVDKNGINLSPASYSVKEIVLTSHKGKEREISQIVTGFSISESLYSPSLKLKIDIKDVNNFFEDFPIIGQEKIHLEIQKKTHDLVYDISLSFIITEYPLFGRAQAEHTQVYTLMGISPFAYISNLKKISKSFSDKTTEVIKSIYENDLKQELIVTGNSISRAKGIIPIMNPIQACNWLRTKSFDDKMSPFYLYQTLSGVCQLTSHYALNQSEVYESYIDIRGWNAEPSKTKDMYKQKARRILNVTSDLKLGKMFQSMDGAFSSSNQFLDISGKTFVKKNFNYNDLIGEKNNDNYDKSRLTNGQFPVLSETFQVQGETLDKLNTSHLEHISLNTQAWDGQEETLNDKRSVVNGHSRSYIENFDTMVHDLRLFGDFRLNAGRKIKLRFPKACDPSQNKNILDENKDDLFDKHLSGDYIISSVVHVFDNGEHYCNVRAKRDSFSTNINI